MTSPFAVIVVQMIVFVRIQLRGTMLTLPLGLAVDVKGMSDVVMAHFVDCIKFVISDTLAIIIKPAVFHNSICPESAQRQTRRTVCSSSTANRKLHSNRATLEFEEIAAFSAN